LLLVALVVPPLREELEIITGVTPAFHENLKEVLKRSIFEFVISIESNSVVEKRHYAIVGIAS